VFIEHFFKNDKVLGERIFNAFDSKTRDGQISLKEFFAGMAIASRGTKKEKITFLFGMFDLNFDHYLQYSELNMIARSIVVMYSQLLKAADGQQVDAESLTIATNLLVEQAMRFDEDGDGRIDQTEFAEWFYSSYELHLFMEVLHTTFRTSFDVDYVNKYAKLRLEELPADLIGLFHRAQIDDETFNEPDALPFLLEVVEELIEELSSKNQALQVYLNNPLKVDYNKLSDEERSRLISVLTKATMSKNFNVFNRL